MKSKPQSSFVRISFFNETSEFLVKVAFEVKVFETTSPDLPKEKVLFVPAPIDLPITILSSASPSVRSAELPIQILLEPVVHRTPVLLPTKTFPPPVLVLPPAS